MDNENQEIIHYADDNEFRLGCDICDKFAFDTYYNYSSENTNSF